MKTKTKLPKTINLVITEEDRQKAENFCDIYDCLISTALRRRGYEEVNEWVSACSIGKQDYRHDPMGPEDLHQDDFATSRPFYLPSVVGLKIKLTRVDLQ